MPDSVKNRFSPLLWTVPSHPYSSSPGPPTLTAAIWIHYEFKGITCTNESQLCSTPLAQKLGANTLIFVSLGLLLNFCPPISHISPFLVTKKWWSYVSKCMCYSYQDICVFSNEKGESDKWIPNHPHPLYSATLDTAALEQPHFHPDLGLFVESALPPAAPTLHKTSGLSPRNDFCSELLSIHQGKDFSCQLLVRAPKREWVLVSFISTLCSVPGHLHIFY